MVSEQIQKEVIKTAMSDQVFFETLRPLFDPMTMFNNDNVVQWNNLVEFYDKHGVLSESISKEVFGEFYNSVCLDPKRCEYVKQHIIEIVTHNNTVSIIKKIVEEMAMKKEKMNREDVTKLLREAQEQINIKNDDSEEISIMDSAEQRMNSVIQRVGVPTGLPTLDENLMYKGVTGGELAVVIAPPSGGKSALLVNFAFNALQAGFNVLYLTFELHPNFIYNRIVQRLLNKTSDEIVISKDETIREIERWKKSVSKNLVIKGMRKKKYTIADISRYVNNKIKEGFKPDVIFVDYADIITASAIKEKRHEIGEIYKGLWNIAQELDLPLWTASQTNREGIGKATIDIDNLSEDISKAFTSDLIISLCQTMEDRISLDAKIYIAKNRNFRAKKEIPVKFISERMLICELDQYEYFRRDEDIYVNAE